MTFNINQFQLPPVSRKYNRKKTTFKNKSRKINKKRGLLNPRAGIIVHPDPCADFFLFLLRRFIFVKFYGRYLVILKKCDTLPE